MKPFDVYPYPRWARPGEGSFQSGAGAISYWQDAACAPVAAALKRERNRWGLPAPLSPASAGKATIAVGLIEGAEIAARLDQAGVRPEGALPAEGYVLAITPKEITVAGADASGCLYGLNTLSQLLKVAGGSVEAPTMQIRDWPYKALRGIHVYMPSRAGIPFYKDMLAWLASLRYNTVFLEIAGGMRYDRHPEVNEAWEKFCQEARAFPGGPQQLQQSQPYPKDSTHTELGGGSYLEKEEVKELIEFAKSYGIETIPELQSLSHAYYMVIPHPEIAEREYDPWPDTYCPSNPRSYEIYFDLLDEVIELFQPRMVHIGHDEAYTFGVCDRCRHKSGAELLAGDLIKIHDYLAQRGIKTVLWGDKLQNIIIGGVDHGGRARRSVSAAKEMDHTMRETYQAVDFVPKDFVIMDWYWCLDPNSEQFFRRKGFAEIIFGNFGNNFAPQAFDRWQERSAGESILGAEVSTWCELDEYALGHNLALYNFLFSANMLWWPHYNDRERELNLEAVARLQPWARQELGKVSLPSLHDAKSRAITLPGKPAVEATGGSFTGLANAVFSLGGALAAGGNAAASAAVAVGAKADSLAFLHYALTARRLRPSWAFEEPLEPDAHNLLGHYLVRYADGSQEKVAIRYGDNISRPDLIYGEDVASSPFWAQPAWQGRDEQGRRTTLWAHEWLNPHPEKEIAQVSLHYEGEDPDEKIVLLGLVALERS